MAMITCSECGRAVSNKAAACIGCGAPLSASHDVNFAMPAKVNAPPSPQQIKRRAAKHSDDGQADPHHGLNFFSRQPQP